MLANLVRIMRLRAGSKALVVGITAAALVALAGGWAFASLRPGHVSPSTSTPTSAAVRSARSAASATSPNDRPTLAPQSGISQTNPPQGAAAPAVLKLPTSLLLAGPQVLAEINVPGNAGSATQRSATGGGSAQFFHFGFTAQRHLNGNVAGTVTGNAEVIFVAPNPGTLHVDVNCLEIVGNDAYVSGVLTYAAFGLAKGTEMLFGVEDNVGGSKPELISDIYYWPTPAFTCHNFHAKPHFAVQGNIELH